MNTAFRKLPPRAEFLDLGKLPHLYQTRPGLHHSRRMLVFIAMILASLGAWAQGAGGEPDAAATRECPTVVQGREPGENYGQPYPSGLSSQQDDDPEKRLEWFMEQRTYPTGAIPQEAYGEASDAFLKAREETRLIHEERLAEGVEAEEEALPTGPWAQVGPAPIGNTLSYLKFGNVAGRVSAIAVHPTNPALVIAGASKGGIWRTINATAATPDWTPVGDGQSTLAIAGASWTVYANDASFDSEGSAFYGPWIGTTGNNRLWHGAKSLWYCRFPGHRSRWNKMGTTNLASISRSKYVSKLAIHNPSEGVFGPFYAANAAPRAFLQSDDGLKWRNRTGTLPNKYISFIVFDPSAPASVWVTLQGFGTGHVWYSPDGGKTWQDNSGNLPNVPTNCILLDPLDRANTWYVGTDVGVYGTTNAGGTWSAIGSNLPAVVVSDLELDQNRLLYAATGGRSVWAIQLARPKSDHVFVWGSDFSVEQAGRP